MTRILAVLACGWLAATALTTPALAAPKDEAKEGDQPPASASSGEVVDYWELMTDSEIAEHQQKMRAATSRAEREKIRAEHHAEMQKRAQARGLSVQCPCDCGASGGMGKGPGQGGAGMGKGQGGGPGKGPGAGR